MKVYVADNKELCISYSNDDRCLNCNNRSKCPYIKSITREAVVPRYDQIIMVDCELYKEFSLKTVLKNTILLIFWAVIAIYAVFK